VIYFTSKEAKIIDRLRRAAIDHGEVHDLLCILSEVIYENDGKLILSNHEEDEEGIRYLQVAQLAAAFSQLDWNEAKEEVDTINPSPRPQEQNND